MKWKIRDIEIENQIVVAPMAGITNQAFRLCCKEFGAGLIYTEMLSDKAIQFENVKTLEMAEVLPEEQPISMQLFGSEIESMVYAAKKLDAESDCKIIDINMGCPAPKIIKTNAGSSLMKNIDEAYALVKAVVDNVKKPVTVKMRIGWDETTINCVEMAKKLESAGISAIALHGRTRVQMYEGKANWDYIKQVKQAVNIPVIGNGDVTSPEEAKRMLEETGCDAVMIGRGVLGDPWLIKRCINYLDGKQDDETTSIHDRFNMARLHAQRLIKIKGEVVALKEMRGHAVWYIKGLPFANKIKNDLSKVSTYLELDSILSKYEKDIIEYQIMKNKA